MPNLAHAIKEHKSIYAVLPVSNAVEFKQFQNIQKQLYRDDPFWVPPLYSEEKQFFSDKNPYMRNNQSQLFLLKKQGEVVGRIAATVCKAHNSHWGEKTGFFGFFECEKDMDSAKELFSAATEYLKNKGMNKVRGPLNLTTNHTSGLLVDGYDSSPLIEMTYNHDYYHELLENSGFMGIKDLFAYWVDLTQGVPKEDTMKRILRRFKQKDISIRNVRTSGAGFHHDMNLFYDIYQSAWRNNWGFVPVEKEEYEFMVERMRPLVNPDLALIAEIDGEPAGFYLTVPDFNQVIKIIKGKLNPINIIRILYEQKNIKSGRLIVAGIKDEFKHTPLASLMFYKSLKAAHAKNYKGVELSWILEDNYDARKFVEHFNIPIYKRYRIFEKII